MADQGIGGDQYDPDEYPEDLLNDEAIPEEYEVRWDISSSTCLLKINLSTFINSNRS